MELSEKQIQDFAIDVLQKHPKVAWAHRMNVGAVRRGGRYIRFGKKGMCDITGQLKTGRRLEIEMKRPGEKATQDQLDYIAMVNAHGGLAFIAYRVIDIVEALAQA